MFRRWRNLSLAAVCVFSLGACDLYFGDPEPQPFPPGGDDVGAGSPSPDASIAGCAADRDCDADSYCEEEWGECYPSTKCAMDLDCGGGMVCSDREVCVPSPCGGNDDCMAGCYCDIDLGRCVETGFCDADDDCPIDMTCDERATCVPEHDDCDE